jgi:hypothetical protein
VFVSGKPLQPSLMFPGKGRSLLEREIPLKGDPLGLDSGRIYKHYTKLERLTLLQSFVNYVRKKYYKQAFSAYINVFRIRPGAYPGVKHLKGT